MHGLRILIGGCLVWSLARGAAAAPPLRDAAPLDGSSDGWRWLERPLPVGTSELRGVWASDGEHAWAVGSDGTLVGGGAGREWQAQATGTRAVLEGVWGSGAKEVFVVGAGGTILHTADGGATWAAQASGVRGALRGVWGTGARNVFAVGVGGTILHSSDGGASWTTQPSGTTATLRRVWGTGASDVYAVGEKSTILHSVDGGATWSAETVPQDLNVLAVAGDGRGGLCATAQSTKGSYGNVLLRRDRGTWRGEPVGAPGAWIAHASGRLWMGGHAVVAVSSDGGHTFSEQSGPAGLGRIQTMTITDDGHAFFAAGGYARDKVVGRVFHLPPGPAIGRRPTVPAVAAGPISPPPPKPAPLELVPQIGHTQPITALAATTDARRAISVSEDSVKLWDTDAGLLLRTFDFGTAATHIAVSGDGTRGLVTGSSMRGVPLFDVASGRVLRTLPLVGEVTSASALALSGDGHTAAIADGGVVYVWDLEHGIMLRSLPAPSRPLALSRDGRTLLAGATVWSVPGDGPRHRLLPAGTSAIDGGFTVDGARVVLLHGAASGSKNLSVFDLQSGARVATVATDGECAVALPGGRVRAALGTYDGKVLVWDVGAAKNERTLRDSEAGISGLAASRDGRRLVVATRGGAIVTWDVATGARQRIMYAHAQGTAAAFSPDGRRLATGGQGAALWEVATGTVTRVSNLDEPLVTSVGFPPDGRRLLAAGPHLTLGAFDVGTGARQFSSPPVPLLASRTAFSPDGRHALLALDGDKYVHFGYLELRDLVPGKAEPRKMAVAAHDVLLTAYLPDGARALAADSRSRVELWNLESEKLIASLTDGCHATALSVSPDGRHALVVCDGQDVALWDLEARRMERRVGARGSKAVAFTPDGRRALIGDGRDLVEVELADGREVRRYTGHRGAILAVAASPDGALAVSGSADGTYRLWRRESGASLILLTSADDWLLYDDEGRFDASRHGADLLAAVQGLSGYRIDQLAARNNRPDLLLERLGLGDPEHLAHLRSRHAQRLRQLGLIEERLAAGFDRAPTAHIASIRAEGKRATLAIELKAQATPLARYNVYVNDVPLHGALGAAVSGERARLTEQVDLTSGTNRVEVAAVDASGAESLRAMEVVEYAGAARGELWFIGFGVSRYRNPAYALSYPHKDVLDLAEVLRGAGGAYDKVHVTTFVNEQVTVERLKAARRSLAGAGVDDTVVVLVAGHGMHARDALANYYYLTHDADAGHLAETAAEFSLVEALLQDIAPRRKLLLLDTCESGEVDDKELPPPPAPDERGLTARAIRGAAPLASTARPRPRPWLLDRERYIYNDLSRRSGAVVLASSRGSEASWELDELRNGVFTKEILTALVTTAADSDGDGRVTIAELVHYVRGAVAGRTRERQHPELQRDNKDARLSLPVIRAAEPVLSRPDPLAK